MAIEFGIWKIDEENKPVALTGMPLERQLQEILLKDITLIDPELVVIGREVATKYGGRIDILAVDPEGSLVVIELKRDRTPRDVVAQLLDYGSWVLQITPEEIQDIYVEYQASRPQAPALVSVFDDLRERFGSEPESLNAKHRLIVVASEVDHATERIIAYLRDGYDLDINVLLFRAFEDLGKQYFARAWLHEGQPLGNVENAAVSPKLEWNGEFFVNVGEDYYIRGWEDAMRLGFVSAGGGARYEKAMRQLKVGNRFWAYLSQEGYVGYGEVQAEAVPFADYVVELDDSHMALAEAGLEGKWDFGVDHEEFVVKVKWIKAVERTEALWENGMFVGRQTLERPRTVKWRDTLEILRRQWRVEEDT